MSERWKRLHLAHRDVDDMTVVVHARDGHVVTFDNVGSVLWHRLETAQDEDQLVAYLRERFEMGDEHDPAKDVTAFIEQLKELNLIERCS